MAAAPEHFTVVFDGARDNVRRARAVASEFARRHGASEQTIFEIELAVSEACTNALIHDHADGPGGFVLTGVLVDGRLALEISDEGGGVRLDRMSDGLGLGLPIMDRVARAVDVDTVPGHGTTVRLAFLL
jgi:anti-sigma regulatory factor (Ser/Thr protein kinase)